MLIDKNIMGKNLKRLRQERGLTLEKLAELTDMSINTIARFELGKNTNVRLDTLLRICSELDTTPDALLGLQPNQDRFAEYQELIAELSALPAAKRQALLATLIAFIRV
ncbi:helix-turn-helix transcriptional regulator [Leuconostocaceae bacterium ESL0958]|nr:helix-turn-helix transcriptional regulator [Leuconostocaceae bacterium ESL0958]